MERLCIYPKDIRTITGLSERYARNVLRKIRQLHNKAPHQLVTVEEFSHYIGLDPADVRKRLR